MTLKAVLHLPLRATQGFVSSLLELMNLPLKAPDYSLLCLRQKSLKSTYRNKTARSGPMHLVVDATGLKLYGEGEWKVKIQGKAKRRSWVKVHLAVDESTHTIEACLATADTVHESEALPHLLNQIQQSISQVTADGAYDTHNAYEATLKQGGKPCFPPRVNASRHKATDEAWRFRNHAVSQVKYHGLNYWKKKHNYHRRSLAETAMFRLKQLLGNKIQARTLTRQGCEIGIKCVILNKMTQLGMPQH